MVKLTTSVQLHFSAASHLTQALEELHEQQSELAAGVAPHTLIDPREGELSGHLSLVKPDASEDEVGSRRRSLC